MFNFCIVYCRWRLNHIYIDYLCWLFCCYGNLCLYVCDFVVRQSADSNKRVMKIGGLLAGSDVITKVISADNCSDFYYLFPYMNVFIVLDVFVWIHEWKVTEGFHRSLPEWQGDVTNDYYFWLMNNWRNSCFSSHFWLWISYDVWMIFFFVY